MPRALADAGLLPPAGKQAAGFTTPPVKGSSAAASSPGGSTNAAGLPSPFAADAAEDENLEATRLRALNTLLKRRLDDVQRTDNKCAHSVAALQCRRLAAARSDARCVRAFCIG